MEPTKKKKPSRFISVRLPAMLKRSERRESGSLSAHAQLCSRELPKVESDEQVPFRSCNPNPTLKCTPSSSNCN